HGLNIPRFYILLHVSHNPGINYIDLSDLLLCTKSNTTRVVQGMVKDELIIRENDPNDRRRYKLFLTDKGTNVLPPGYPAFINHIESLFFRCTDQEASQYLEVSRHIESSLSPGSTLNPTNSQVLASMMASDG